MERTDISAKDSPPGKRNPLGQRCTAGHSLLLTKRRQALLGPVAHVRLDEAGTGAHAQAQGLGDGCGRLLGALEGRGVDGHRRLGQRGDPRRPPPRPGPDPSRPGAARLPGPGGPCRSSASSRGAPAGRGWRRAACGRCPDSWWIGRRWCGQRSAREAIVGSAPWRPAGGRATRWPSCNRRWRTCRRCPRLVRWREEVARTGRASYAGQVYWGRGVPGFGDPAAALDPGRPGSGGPRGQPHRAHVHRRPLGRLALRRALQGRIRLAAHQHVGRRRVDPARRLHHGHGPLRAARQQADARRAGQLRALPEPGARPPDPGRGGGGAGPGGLERAGRALRDAAAAPLRAPGRGRAARRPPAARLVPPEPAEHVHREAHRADVRCRVRPGHAADRRGPVPRKPSRRSQETRS